MHIKAEGVLNKDRYLFECSDGTNTLAMFIDEDDCLMVSVNGESLDMGPFNNYSTFSTIIASFEILDDEVLVCVYNNGYISSDSFTVSLTSNTFETRIASDSNEENIFCGLIAGIVTSLDYKDENNILDLLQCFERESVVDSVDDLSRLSQKKLLKNYRLKRLWI